VARKVVDLEEQRRHHPLDLARFVLVTAFLRDRIELVEEEDAPPRSDSGEHLRKPRGGLAEIARDHLLVPDYEEGKYQRLSEPFCDGGLPVPGRPREEQPMPRLEPVSAKHFDPRLLLDQLVNGRANIRAEDQVIEFLPWRYERDTARPFLRQGGCLCT
jgi:hypothetical protein